MKKAVLRAFNTNWFFYIGFIFISILSYSLVLIPRDIPFLKTLSVLTRYNATRFLPVTTVLLLAALGFKNKKISIIATAIIFFPLFSLALNGLWAGAYSENYVLSGLVPRSDAFGFYTGAISLLENGFFTSIAQRRPLYGGFLAFILWAAGGNLQIALAVIAFLTAVVCYFSVMAVKNTYNAPTAIIYFFVLFLFIRRFIGITMSENMGFLLGTSSFTCFLIALNKYTLNKKEGVSVFLTAALLFSLSQAARPGAIVILPLLILFAGWLWKDQQKFSLKWMTAAGIVMTAGFLINTYLFNITSPENTSQFSNLGYGIYGLAVGGKGWEQIFTDHPEINFLAAGTREQQIIKIIFQEIINHPGNFMRGLATQFKILFSFQSTNSIFSFVYSSNAFFNFTLMALLFLFSIFGVASALKEYKKPTSAFILLLTLGFLLSLIPAPAYQTQYMRVYASSIFLIGFLPAFGFFSLVNRLPCAFRKMMIFQPSNQNKLTKPTIIFSICLLVFIVSSPITVKLLSPTKIPLYKACPEGQEDVVVKYFPGSGINIVQNSPEITTWVPVVTKFDYKGSIHNICCGDEIIYFENIPTPNVLYPTVNLLNGNGLYLIVNESQLPTEKMLLHICGRIEDVYGKTSDQGFLYPTTIDTMQPN